MKRITLIIFLFLSISNVFAYKFKIEGTIVDYQNFTPIAKHYVNIHDQLGNYDEITVYTNINGFYSVTFEIEEVNPIIFIVQTYGYCESFWIPYTSEITSIDGTKIVDFKICHNPLGLEQTFIIEGYVKNVNTSEPFANHHLTITENYIPSQTTELITDENGFFSHTYTLPPLYIVDFMIETVANCNMEWITYSDTVKNFEGTFHEDFLICHNPLWYIADYKINGTILDDLNNLPVNNHPVYIVKQLPNYQIYKVYTNDTGYYTIDFEINLLEANTFKILTYSLCNDVWIYYQDYTTGYAGEYTKDFEICNYNNSDISCKATFTYNIDYANNIVSFYEISLDNITDRYWTLGDGYFSSNHFFTHQYAESGIYEVCINITTADNCVNTFCDSIIVGNFYTFEGRVFAGDNLLPTGKMLLYKYSDGKYDYTDYSDINQGLYNFDHVFSGFYTTYAIPEFDVDFLYFPKYLPTYYFNNLIWQNSNRININNNFVNNDIHLIRYDDIFYGKGEISGEFFFNLNTTSIRNNFEINVIIFDEDDNAINFSEVDEFNKYKFKDLPYGTYKIYPENAERTTNPQILTINSTRPLISNADFVVTDNYIDFLTDIDELDASKNNFTIYPNPVKDLLYLNSEEITQNCEIIITDLTGKKCLTKTLSEQNIILNLKHFKTGIYFIQIIDFNQIIFTEKIIKL